MKKQAPHLPAESCSVAAHRSWQDIKVLMVLVVIALLSGATAALLLFNWFLPTLSQDGGLSLINRPLTDRGRIVLEAEPRLVRETNERLVEIYDRRKQIGTAYPDTARIGRAVVLSSDGWLVLSEAADEKINVSSLLAVDYRGMTYPVEKLLRDSTRGFLFLKIAASDLRVTPLAPWGVELPGTDVWILNGAWSAAEVLNYVHADDAHFTLNTGIDQYRLSRAVPAGSIVITTQGALVGFVDEAGWLRLGWPIAYHLPGVLGKADLVVPPFTLRGVMVHGYTPSDEATLVASPGLYIQEVRGITGFQAGDIITHLNGQPLREETAARMLHFLPDTFEATVVREQTVQQVTINI